MVVKRLNNDKIKDTMEDWKNKIVTATMTLCIAASSWFLNQAWDKIAKLESEVQQIKIDAASHNGNRFTSSDWVKAKELLDAERTTMDRRLVRLEETIPTIKEMLLEIKTEIKKP